MDELTPIRKQYLQIKKKYPNMILFFRLGDFYETFDEDARTTSKELDIVLTSRNVAKGNRIPMAGIPYHAVDNYLGRLISKGYHVAICEQVGSQPKNGLFSREVVRIVTPGTLLEPEMLSTDKPNYLMCLIIDNDQAGISYADISTGLFRTTQIRSDNLFSVVRSEISRLAPSEILIPEPFNLEGLESFHLSRIPAWKFELSQCSRILKDFFEVNSLDGYGLRGNPLSTRSAGVIVQYLSDTQQAALPALRNLTNYSLTDFLIMDGVTRRNLELTSTIRNNDQNGTLLSILDHTKTPMGHRLLREWINKPLLDISAINARLEKVEQLFNRTNLRIELSSLLSKVCDIERVINRILAHQAIPRELLAVRVTLEILPKIAKLLIEEGLQDLFLDNFSILSQELELIKCSIDDDSPATLQHTGIIKKGYSEELDRIVNSSQSARQWIADLEEIEKKKTGIKTLKVGFNKIFGYYIEISRGAAGDVPQEYIRKQTLVNSERFITAEMKEYESIVLNAEERIHDLEIALFRNVLTILSKSSNSFLSTARTIAEMDALLSFTEAAVNNNYTKPFVSNNTALEIIESRHPVVEKLLTDERFIPNNAIFGDGEIIQIITGPNMSGKSTFLRQVALIVLMAQIGCFVPAATAKIGVVDRIFTRIGAQDEIFSGQSTFMVEMTETASILNSATSRSLLILDEIGRGTSTYDGVAIAWSVIEYIHNHPDLKARTLFATHYHELLSLTEMLPGVKNYNVAVVESDGKIVFMHKIIEGGSDRSYGIHVAQLAGLPKPLIQRAYEIIRSLEATSGEVLHAADKSINQLKLFPENNPFIEELSKLDPNGLTPLEALNKLYEWKKKYISRD